MTGVASLSDKNDQRQLTGDKNVGDFVLQFIGGINDGNAHQNKLDFDNKFGKRLLPFDLRSKACRLSGIDS